MMMLPTEKIWSIEPGRFDSMLNQMRGAVSQANAAPARRAAFQRSGAVAIIPVQGPLEKHQTLLGFLFGGSSMIAIADAVRAAVRDEKIREIILDIDSPGGTVAGNADLADEVFAARKRKPITAVISDIGASGAYVIASQATSIVANKTALVGSIGVLLIVRDFSAALEGEGIKVHVIKSGKFKGAGAFGAKITDEQLVEFQRIVDGMNGEFVSVIARGRGVAASQIASLADGRVHIADDAKKLGLIDGIARLEDVIAERIAAHSAVGTPPARPVGDPISQTSITPARARAKHECATVREMRQARERKEQTMTTATVSPSPSSDDGEAQFKALVSKYMRDFKISQSAAHKRVMSDYPKLHRRYIKAFNARYGRKAPGW